MVLLGTTILWEDEALPHKWFERWGASLIGAQCRAAAEKAKNHKVTVSGSTAQGGEALEAML